MSSRLPIARREDFGPPADEDELPEARLEDFGPQAAPAAVGMGEARYVENYMARAEEGARRPIQGPPELRDVAAQRLARLQAETPAQQPRANVDPRHMRLDPSVQRMMTPRPPEDVPELIEPTVRGDQIRDAIAFSADKLGEAYGVPGGQAIVGRALETPVGRAATDFLAEQTTPENAALMGVGGKLAAQGGGQAMKWAGRALAGSMVPGAMQSGEQAAEAYGAGDPEAPYYATKAAMFAGMVGGPLAAESVAGRVAKRANERAIPRDVAAAQEAVVRLRAAKDRLQAQREGLDVTATMAGVRRQASADLPMAAAEDFGPPTGAVERIQRQRRFEQQPPRTRPVSRVFEGEARPRAPETLADLTMPPEPPAPLPEPRPFPEDAEVYVDREGRIQVGRAPAEPIPLRPGELPVGEEALFPRGQEPQERIDLERPAKPPPEPPTAPPAPQEPRPIPPKPAPPAQDYVDLTPLERQQLRTARPKDTRELFGEGIPPEFDRGQPPATDMEAPRFGEEERRGRQDRRVHQDYDQIPEPDRREAFRRMQEDLDAAETDAVTGLRIRQAYNRHKAENPGLPEAAFDADGLKTINDTKGHPAGDQALKIVGAAVRSIADRLGGEAFRMGGDEFSIRARDAEKLSQASSRIQRALDEQEWDVTLSNGTTEKVKIGVSYGVGPDYQTADRALYADKTRRRLAREAEFRPEEFEREAGRREPTWADRGEYPSREADAGPERARLEGSPEELARQEREALQGRPTETEREAVKAEAATLGVDEEGNLPETPAQRLRRLVRERKAAAKPRPGALRDAAGNKILTDQQQAFKDSYRFAGGGKKKLHQPKVERMPDVPERPADYPPDAWNRLTDAQKRGQVDESEGPAATFLHGKKPEAEGRVSEMEKDAAALAAAPKPQTSEQTYRENEEKFEAREKERREFAGTPDKEAIDDFSPEASERMRLQEERDARRREAGVKPPSGKTGTGDMFGEQSGRGGTKKGDQQTLDDALGDPKKPAQAAKLAGRPQLTVSPERLPAGQTQRKPSEIVKQIEESFGRFGYLPVKTRHFRQHAHGITKIREQVVRLGVSNDLVTLAHELGHHVQESVFKLPTGKGLPYEGELARLGAATSRPSYPPHQVQQEGTAEFMRHYLLDPKKARRLAPAYAAAFDQALASRPDVAQAILDAQRQIRGHYAETPVDRIKSKIDFKGEDDGKTGTFTQRAMTRWVDDLQPLKDAVRTMDGGQSRDVLADAYTLARLTRGAPGKAEGFLRYGVKTRDGQKLAGSLAEALEPVRAKLEDLSVYLASKHAIELHGRGIESGMDLEDARAAVKALESPEFEKAAESVYAYSDALLKYAQREGVLSGEQVAKIRELNEAYVPFQRVRDAVDISWSGASKKMADRGSPIKRIKGSGRDVINPLESIIRNTYTIVDMVEKNTAMRALVEQARATEGGGRFVEAIPPPMEATKFNLSSVTKQIREQLEMAGVDLPDNLSEALDVAATVFTPANFSKEKGIITIVENGKRKFYSVNEPALYEAITAIGPRNTSMAVALLERPARLLRAGATLTPGFAGRNIVRDTVGAAVNSRYGFRPAWDTMRGLAEYMKQGKAYQDFLNSGGANANLVSADRNSQRRMLKELSGDKRFRDSIILHPIELLRAISEASENSTRLGEFMRAVQKEGRTAEGLARGGLAARDVTLDFARGGTAAREINRYVAFFNAQAQGNVRLVEVFKRNSVAATMRAVGAITIPTLAFAYLNKDDKEYANLPDWEKNTFWHLRVGDGWARIPKPHGALASVFANVPEAFARHVHAKDPGALDRLFPDEDAAWSAIIGLTPTAIMPAVEIYANYDTYRKRAIVSPWDLEVDKELQVNRWTSELARFVGPKMGLAPAKFDHLINGYTAGLGRGLARGLNAPLRRLSGRPEPPKAGLSGTPLLGAFYRNAPGADAEVFRRFYARRDELDGAIRSAKLYREQGQDSKATARLGTAKEKLGAEPVFEAKRIRKAANQISEQRKEVNRVFASDATPEDKREQLDAIYKRMIRLATEAMEGKK